jgi:hypothetical protein
MRRRQRLRVPGACLALLLTAQFADALTPTQSAADDIDALRKEVTELRSKVEKPPKDFWDMISSTSVLISGIAVAFIGFYATNIYNKTVLKPTSAEKIS